jgi:hypothetical protein
MSILDTIRNIILEDKNLDIDAWSDASYVDQGTDGTDREALASTPPVLEAIVSSPGLLAMLADALKPHLDALADE